VQTADAYVNLFTFDPASKELQESVGIRGETDSGIWL
jgi:hypothetical protein